MPEYLFSFAFMIANSNDHTDVLFQNSRLYVIFGNRILSRLYLRGVCKNILLFRMLALLIIVIIYIQNSETISIAQIRERAAVLASYGAVTITFLSCRNLDSIPAIYVGVNCARTCFASGTIYYAGILPFAHNFIS